MLLYALSLLLILWVTLALQGMLKESPIMGCLTFFLLALVGAGVVLGLFLKEVFAP